MLSGLCFLRKRSGNYFSSKCSKMRVNIFTSSALRWSQQSKQWAVLIRPAKDSWYYVPAFPSRAPLHAPCPAPQMAPASTKRDPGAQRQDETGNASGCGASLPEKVPLPASALPLSLRPTPPGLGSRLARSAGQPVSSTTPPLRLHTCITDESPSASHPLKSWLTPAGICPCRFPGPPALPVRAAPTPTWGSVRS